MGAFRLMTNGGDTVDDLTISGKARLDILNAAFHAGKLGAHIAPSLSCVDIMIAVLREYGPNAVILSKGHGALGYYSAMHQLSFMTDAQFDSFETDGGEYPGQPSRSDTNGIIYSGGSLGMGLPYGTGVAYGNRSRRVIVVMGDGELNEGSVWEAASLAARLGLSNLIAVVDGNSFQSDGTCESVLNMDIPALWAAYGWNTIKCDGHDVSAVRKSLRETAITKPTAVLARTIKGKGVSFMENNNQWHHSALKQSDYESAVQEVITGYGLH